MCKGKELPIPDNEHLRFYELLKEYKGQQGALIPLLQKTQSIFGYLPEPALERIAESLKLPLSQIYGVATFYSQFRLKPQGRHVVKVCQGTACHVRGAARIMERLQKELKVKSGETTEDLRFTVESVACLGACGLAPVMMVDDNAHGRLTPDLIPEILSKYV